MRVLLIQPNATEETSREYVSLQYPINLGYIASVLKQESHEVKMLDLNVMPQTQLIETLQKFKPEIVGLTAMTPTIYNAKKIIQQVKSMDNKIITVLGGVHASALPLETMKEISTLDYLIFGEGERTLIELLKHIEKKKPKDMRKIKGIVFRNKGKIIKNERRELIENLDSLPYPARDLVNMELYNKAHVVRGISRKEMKIIEIMTSRGCPNQCIFCAGHINYGRRVRFRGYENIIGEIEETIKKYKINHVDIEDDTFTLNKLLVKKLCNFFKRKKLSWSCNARVDTINYDLLRLMAESGCKMIAFGVEAGNQKMLDKIKKGITTQQIIKAFRYAKKAGIRFVEADFMIGSHPDETLDDVKDTEKLAHKLKSDFLALAIMCPFPGTEIYEIMKKRNYLYEKTDWSQFSMFGSLKRYKRLKYLTPKQMSHLQKKIMRRYYLSLKYIFSQITQIRTFGEIKYFFRLSSLFLKEFIFKNA